MTTLADLTRLTAALVTRIVSGSATTTPGNATTLVDTVNLAGFPDNNFNGGTIWITSGANAGRSRLITDFEDAADRLTFAAFPSNIVSGVTWEACDSSFVEYRDLRQAVNLALREIGKIIADPPDESITTVAGQRIYDLPAGVSHVQGIEIVEDIGTVDEKNPINTHWEERQGQLVFDDGREPDGDKTIRILYETMHAAMYVDTDALSSQIDEKYLVYLAARQAMRLSYKRFGKAGDETIPEWLNEAIEETKKHICLNEGMPRIKVRTA